MKSNLNLKSSPTLSDIQQYVRDLELERGFTRCTVLEQYVLLTEEIGELAKCLRKLNANMSIDSSKKYRLDAQDELADILIMLCAVANRLDVDLERAFREKEGENKNRSWS